MRALKHPFLAAISRARYNADKMMQYSHNAAINYITRRTINGKKHIAAAYFNEALITTGQPPPPLGTRQPSLKSPRDNSPPVHSLFNKEMCALITTAGDPSPPPRAQQCHGLYTRLCDGLCTRLCHERPRRVFCRWVPAWRGERLQQGDAATRTAVCTAARTVSQRSWAEITSEITYFWPESPRLHPWPEYSRRGGSPDGPSRHQRDAGATPA